MRASFIVLAVVAPILTPVAAAAALAGSPPEDPIAVEVIAGNGGVLLSWSPVPGAQSYLVYRWANGGSPQLLTNTTLPEYWDADAPAGAAYGVSAVQGDQQSPIQVISQDSSAGDCVSFNSEFHVAITIANCVHRGD
jgi:hypothetical protein